MLIVTDDYHTLTHHITSQQLSSRQTDRQTVNLLNPPKSPPPSHPGIELSKIRTAQLGKLNELSNHSGE